MSQTRHINLATKITADVCREVENQQPTGRITAAIQSAHAARLDRISSCALLATCDPDLRDRHPCKAAAPKRGGLTSWTTLNT